MRNIFVLLTFFTVFALQNVSSYTESPKKIRSCPRHFMKIGRRCYFFSRNAVTWQEAYYRCNDKKSAIAVIKSPNQDRRIRRILSRPTHATRERWLGGMYNWKQMKWIWASSAKPLTYQGFAVQNSTENQKWHCIIMDPALDYKWSTRPCIEKKPYICHTKTRIITKKYDNRHLNEIPLSNDIRQEPSNLREYPDKKHLNETENEITKFTREKRRKKQRRRKRIHNSTILWHRPIGEKSYNVTDKHNASLDTIKYEIYKEESQIGNSLYPKPIVEEYSFIKTP